MESPPALPPPGFPAPPDIVAVMGSKFKQAAYLSRLGRGMEPEPDPSIPFFPLNNFSTKATFPVRAASSSSCSFPIPDTSLQRQGNRNPTNLPYTPPFLPPPTPFFTVWCGKASERIPITACCCCCCCCTVEIGVTDAADQLWRALLS